MHLVSPPVFIAAISTYRTLVDMDPMALFTSILGSGSTILVGLRSLAQIFGSAFLLLGHAERAKADPGNWRVLIKSGVLCVLLFAGGQMLGFIANAMNQAPADVGLMNDTPSMLTALFQRGVQLPSWSAMWAPLVGDPAVDSLTVAGALSAGTDAAAAGTPAPGTPGTPPPPGTPTHAGTGVGHWITTHLADLGISGLFKSISGFLTRVFTLLQRLIITSIFLLELVIILLIGMFLIWGMETLRFFALLVGATILPLFVGFISTSMMHETGWRYVTKMIGITLWPLGWALCNAVTLEMFDMAVRVASGDAGTAASATFVGALSTPGSAVTWSQFSNVVMTSAPMSFVMGQGILILTGIFMVYSAISVPKMINQTLLMGEEFLVSAMAGNAKAAADVVSKTVKAATTVALFV